MAFEPIEKFVDAERFVNQTIERIQRCVRNQNVYLTISGGVDSSAVGMIMYRALLDGLVAEHYDHGGMRMGEPKRVLKDLNEFFPVKFYDASEYYMKRVMEAGENSEKKRVAFSAAYFTTMLERAKQYGCKFVADGTIKPDWEETVKMGLKWQHNIPTDEIKKEIEDAGIQFIYPLFYQAKPQSRAIAELYNLPMAQRRPFPGPGLYVRAIGQVTPEKMKVTRLADGITTPALSEIVEARENGLDKQYFCAIIESTKAPFSVEGSFDGVRIIGANVFNTKVTGMHENKRTYGRLLAIDSDSEIPDLIGQANNIVRANSGQDIGRVVLNVRSRSKGEFTALLRAIETRDFRTAEVVPMYWKSLQNIADDLFERMSELSGVAFDIQPKPDSTIEFE